MENVPEPIKGIHRLILSTVNAVTYIIVGVILVF